MRDATHEVLSSEPKCMSLFSLSIAVLMRMAIRSQVTADLHNFTLASKESKLSVDDCYWAAN
jgi:hypothetical protein